MILTLESHVLLLKWINELLTLDIKTLTKKDVVFPTIDFSDCSKLRPNCKRYTVFAIL